MADISSTLEYIHSVKWRGSKPGLSRTRELLRALGNPQQHLKFVHVAGTNGKGSTCACIASGLQQAGYKTGLYTSPFINSFNERMQVCGSEISDEELTELVEVIKPVADAMKDTPTEFEIITALAMLYFRNKQCDITVLETGMGGELDSTNVIDTPELAVITAVDYDHVEFLGPALRDIARAKAGIIKPGADVLIYGGEAVVEDVMRETAMRNNARLHMADFSRITSFQSAGTVSEVTIEPYGEIMLPLAGTYQPYNALVAVTALEMLRGKGYEISDDAIISGLETVKWPGRFEFLGSDPVFILDGAHNLHGVKAALESLHTYYGNDKFIFLIGVLADKDVQSIARAIAATARQVIAVAPDNPRAMKPEELAGIFRHHGVSSIAFNSISEGVRAAIEAAGGRGGKGIVCALGSLYMSCDIKAAHKRLSNKNT